MTMRVEDMFDNKKRIWISITVISTLEYHCDYYTLNHRLFFLSPCCSNSMVCLFSGIESVRYLECSKAVCVLCCFKSKEETSDRHHESLKEC